MPDTNYPWFLFESMDAIEWVYKDFRQRWVLGFADVLSGVTDG